MKKEKDDEMRRALLKIVKTALSALIITIILVFPMNSYSSGLTLRDINGHWAEDHIKELVLKGVINGYPDGSFKPEEFISKAAFIKVLITSLELEIKKDTVFVDTLNHWANGYIGAGIEAGIIVPDEYDDLKYNPHDYITRLEMAKMITRALGKEDEAHSVDVDSLEFVDIEEVEDNLRGYMYIVNEEVIITGYPDGRFGPGDNATRAQTAVVIIRMLQTANQKPMTIAVFGTDERATEIPRSDIIMVLKYFPEKSNITVVSVPRDTRVYIPNIKTDKINHAYAYGGPMLLEETLEKLFDTNIDYYIKLSFEDFKTIIDTLGGVLVNAKKDFVYESNPDNVIVRLGEQVLNGEQALFYVRYRNDSSGDFGRIERQQEVLRSLTYNIFQMDSLAMLPKLFRIYKENVESNLSISDLLANPKILKDRHNITFDCYTLETTSKIIGGGWYELVNEEHLNSIKELLNE